MKESARILVVNDEPNVLETTSRVLMDAGYEVLTATTGRDALHTALEKQPTLVLLEVGLLDMDSLEVCQRMKGEPALAGSFVLMVGSVEEQSGDEAARLEAGADGYVVHSISDRELVARVAAMLRIKRAEERVAHLTRVLRAISNVNQLIVREKDRGRLLQGACDVLVAGRGYYNAWIALLDAAGGLQAVAEAGLGEAFSLLADQLQRGELPRCGQLALVQPEAVVIEGSPAACNGCPLSVSHAGQDRMIVRLRHDSKVLGLLCVSIPGHMATEKEEQAVFQEVAADIALALQAIDAEEEHKQAEQALQKSEERFRTILDNIEDGYYEVDVAGNLTFFNPALARILGRSENELIGMNNRQYMIPEMASAVYEVFGRVFRTGEPERAFDWDLVRKDGERRSVEASVSPVKVDGTITGFRGIVRDVTARKQAEIALHEAEARYRSLVEQIPAAIYTDSAEQVNQTLYISPQLKTMTGHTPQEWIADNDLWLKIMHPDDREHVSAENIRANETGEPFHAEYRIRTPEGRVVWIRDEAILNRDPAGQPLFWQGILLDITEHKRAEQALEESEARFRGIFENATIGLYRTTPDGQILMANPTLVHMLGYSSFEELIQRNLDQEGFEPKYPRSAFQQRIEREGQVIALESAWTRRDGTAIFVCESARAVRDEAGNTLYYEGTAKDITERKQAEDQIREQLDELRRWHSLTIDRESRTLELKHEVNVLLRRLGESIRYPSAEEL